MPTSIFNTTAVIFNDPSQTDNTLLFFKLYSFLPFPLSFLFFPSLSPLLSIHNKSLNPLFPQMKKGLIKHYRFLLPPSLFIIFDYEISAPHSPVIIIIIMCRGVCACITLGARRGYFLLPYSLSLSIFFPVSFFLSLSLPLSLPPAPFMFLSLSFSLS